MHDDIMDRSPLRRGMPTVWKKWNEDTAILSGDVMLIDAYRSIAKCGSAAVLDVFTETAAQVCEGQQFDMEFESRSDVSMPEYEQMIGLKTTGYHHTPMRMAETKVTELFYWLLTFQLCRLT